MFPDQSLNDVVGMSFADTILRIELEICNAACGILTTNCINLLSCENYAPMPFTTSRGFMLVAVSHVFLFCAVPEIIETVIRLVAIVVTAFHSVGARTDEGQKDKTVDRMSSSSGAEANC